MSADCGNGMNKYSVLSYVSAVSPVSHSHPIIHISIKIALMDKKGRHTCASFRRLDGLWVGG